MKRAHVGCFLRRLLVGCGEVWEVFRCRCTSFHKLTVVTLVDDFLAGHRMCDRGFLMCYVSFHSNLSDFICRGWSAVSPAC